MPLDDAQHRASLLTAIGHADRVIEACDVLLRELIAGRLTRYENFRSALALTRIDAESDRAAATAELETVKAYPKETP